MAADSRAKGVRGEAEFARILNDAGLNPINFQSGRTQDADFALNPYRIEVRRRETLHVVKWCEEIEGKTPDHLVPALAFRKNRQPWRVVMTAADWIDLIQNAGGRW